MADVITRFKLETTQYDSKLRDAAKSLQNYVHTTESAGKSFTDFSQKSIQAAKDLGTVASGATNLKDKVKDLVGAYNDAAKAYNKLSQEQQQSDFGKALAESIGQLSSRIKEAKSELYGLGDAMKGAGGGGGLFGGGKFDGMLQVFGGNLMTKAAGFAASLASEMGDMIQQGIELAKQGEGVRIAFERLGRGDILDGLRQATHGTVTDLELMKAAVKFNDFKLPVEELGTMLAFAQQKAKDTGQSVDYMVDSIVTGLGRKSLMILDNLGLSAAEIKEKMKETGDMTKAVGAIIREQMASAGEYVETAADRAAQANVSLQNKMEELGRKFAPLQEASNNLWTSMKIGIMDVVGGPLTNLINKLTEAGRLANAYGILGGNAKVGRMTQNLSNAREENRQGIYQQQQEQFWRYINPREQQIKDIRAWQRGERGEALQSRIGAITEKYGSLDATKIQAEVDAAKKMLADYQQAAKNILNPLSNPTNTTTTTTTTKTKGGSTVDKELAERDRIWQQWLNAQAKLAHDITLYDGQVMLLADAQKLMEKKTREQEQATKKLTDAETERANALKANDLKAYLAANKKVVGAGGESVMPLDFTYTQNNLDAFISNLKERISQADVGSELLDSLNDQLADAQSLGNLMKTAIENGMDAAQFDPQEIFKRIFGDGKTAGDYIGNEFWQGILNSMSQQTGKKFSLNTTTGAVTTAKGKDGGMEQFASDFSKVTGSISSIVSGVQNLGVQIPEGLAKTIGAIQTISGILTAILTVTTLIQATQTAKGGFDILSGFAKIGMAAIGMNRGGLVPHAAVGYLVQGNHYSNDMTPIMANAGELVLNKAQQGNIASQLEGGGLQNLNLSAIITGEQIRLVLNNNGRRTGRGEYVTTNFQRG